MTTTDAEHVCVSLLAFDDETVEGMILHRGSRESCERVAQLLPAIAYNGDKRVIGSAVNIYSADEWQEITAP